MLVPALAVALAATGWLVSLRQMQGMETGTATSLGSPTSFIGIWMSTMAAMMLPAALPAIVLAQKLLPPRRFHDVSLAFAIIALGVLVIAVPGL